jgi:hypothetical protein
MRRRVGLPSNIGVCHDTRSVFKGRNEMPAVDVCPWDSERGRLQRGSTKREMMVPQNLGHCVHKAASMIKTCYKEYEFRR